MSDEYVWTFCYLVRIDPSDFGYASVDSPYLGEVPEGHVIMLPPVFWQYMSDHPELQT